jgi:hypothetical protein
MRIFALAVSLGAASVFASVVKAETFDQMVQASPVIVHARIGQVQVVEDKEAGRIFTYVEVEVLEALKGKTDPRFIVRQTGGDTGVRTTFVEGAPRFSQGQETVLFLEPVRDEPSMLLVHAMAAGKYTFEKDRFGQTRVTRNLRGLAFASPGAKGVRRVVEQEDDGLPEDFLSRLKKSIAGGTR